MLEADWPGNVRELRNCLERACILDASPMLSALSLCGKGNTDATDAVPRTLAEHVASSERRHIVDALAANDGRIAETAAQLGISRKNLWEKMKRHSICASTNDGSA